MYYANDVFYGFISTPYININNTFRGSTPMENVNRIRGLADREEVGSLTAVELKLLPNGIAIMNDPLV
jgi:hypothetical protein